MANLNIAVSHSLTREEAIERVQTMLVKLKKRFSGRIENVSEEWNGNKCKFCLVVMGFSVSGTLTVSKSEIKISGKLPFAALFFKEKIESAIQEQAEKLLA